MPCRHRRRLVLLTPLLAAALPAGAAFARPAWGSFPGPAGQAPRLLPAQAAPEAPPRPPSAPQPPTPPRCTPPSPPTS